MNPNLSVTPSRQKPQTVPLSQTGITCPADTPTIRFRVEPIHTPWMPCQITHVQQHHLIDHIPQAVDLDPLPISDASSHRRIPLKYSRLRDTRQPHFKSSFQRFQNFGTVYHSFRHDIGTWVIRQSDNVKESTHCSKVFKPSVI